MAIAKWILLRAFSNSLEANVVCSFLNSQGIETTTRDEHIVNINWLYSNVVGGVKVLVLNDQRDRAISLLEKQESSAALTVVEGQPCPSCFSKKSEMRGLYSPHFKGAVLMALGLFWPRRRLEGWRCLDCEHSWSEAIEVRGVFFRFISLSIFFLTLAAMIYLLYLKLF